MPRKVPSCRRHKPSGQAVVTRNGRDFYLGEWNSAKSRAEFDRLLAEWLSNGHQLPPTPGSPIGIDGNQERDKPTSHGPKIKGASNQGRSSTSSRRSDGPI